MELICNKTFDEERALYGVDGVRVENCRFEGPADGESALKETANLEVDHCYFALRYPFWHATHAKVKNCALTETCRAAFWYCKDAVLSDVILNGIKAFRECDNSALWGCEGKSDEFGWNCRRIHLQNCYLESSYFLFGSSGVTMCGSKMKGKYSFQYVRNAEIRDCKLDTKDAFWHSEDVTVYDSVLRGEYLGWYSKNLRLVRCKITGTQPLCYCENLVLEDCTMEDCDLAFENCTVQADIRGHIVSVKNPIHGRIVADSFGEIILDEHQREGSDCLIEVRK